ncbi:hypothetical protein [Nonomuraea wenchangensis]|uniref:hypothetical protein n=1 Tax=Nonomuraea wenchangensis TaxID=568860 RepID=UPI0033E97890
MSDEKPPSQAEILVELAQEAYTFHQEPDGSPFALPVNGPKIARPLRGGRTSLRAELAAAYVEDYGKPPSSNSLGDALTALEGFAMRSEPTQTHLRVAKVGDRVTIDLGTGRFVHASPLGWMVSDTSGPVVFRRTELSGMLPEPATVEWSRDGAALAPLWQSLNVSPDHRLPTLAWLVAAMIPDIPHPVLSLWGEQGTGKTTAAKRLVSLIDPSPVPVRTAPRDVEQWIVAASGSHVVFLDNLSGIPEWLSDALCRASTGDGLVRRRLYSDGGLAVSSFRRVVGLTAIDPGALRGDLADRLLAVELERIPDTARKLDAAMAAQWEADLPEIFGALLSTLCEVLTMLPKVHLDALPRMADFALILAAVDEVFATKGKGMRIYLDQRTHLAHDVIESDPVAAMLRKWVNGPNWKPTEADGSWKGSAGDLRALLMGEAPPKGWPATARSMSARLKKVAPALRQLGVVVEQGQRTESMRPWVIYRADVQGKAHQPSGPSERHATGDDQPKQDDGRHDDRMTVESDRHGTVSQPSLLETRSDQGGSVSADGADGHDGSARPALNASPAPRREADPNSCVECGHLLDPTLVKAGKTTHPGCRY